MFGLESLAADPLFVMLAGGTIPSIDTVYRDLARMDEASNSDLERLTAQQELAAVRRTRSERLHCDIDTTVETVFGNQEGAELGYNPRYPGRPSYHPLLSVVAETQTCDGAELRAGRYSRGSPSAPRTPLIGRSIRTLLPQPRTPNTAGSWSSCRAQNQSSWE